MRIATWNVNSLKARLEKVTWWLERARPDVLLMQETKLADADAPRDAFRERRLRRSRTTARAAGTASPSPAACGIDGRGHELRRSRCAPAATTDERRRRAAGRGADDRRRSAAASASSASTRRTAASSTRRSTDAKLAWFERLARWLARRATPDAAARARRRLQRRARRRRRLGSRAPATAAPTSRQPERAGLRAALRAGASSTPTARTTPSPGATPGGTTAPATSTRTSACASITCWSPRRSRARVVWAEIDREARKGKPIPSDHAPLVIDLDEPGHAFDAGWTAAESRIAAAARASRAAEKAPSASSRPRGRTLNVQAVRLACSSRAPPQQMDLFQPPARVFCSR